MSDGERCGAPREGKGPCESKIIACDDCQRCWQHCQHVTDDERTAARTKGGRSTARQKKSHDGVDAPWELETISDAKDWLGRIGRLVLQNEISAKQGHAATRAVEAWLDAQKDAVAMEEFEELQEQLAELRRGEFETVAGDG